jgi:hypothetical protein
MLFAYVDPGLGMLIWQTVVAAFVGTIFYLNKTRKWMVSVVRKIFGREEKPPEVVAEKSANKADVT